MTYSTAGNYTKVFKVFAVPGAEIFSLRDIERFKDPYGNTEGGLPSI